MNFFDEFMSRKAPIGFLLSVIGGSFFSSGNTELIPWAQGLLFAGSALAGGGFLKSDQHYKDKIENREALKQLKDSLNG